MSYLFNFDLNNLYYVYVYMCVYLVFCIGIGLKTGFFVDLNDFWGNLYVATRLNFKKPGSCYNGFFPLGYSLFLKFFSSMYSRTLPFIYNNIFGIAILFSIALLMQVTIFSTVLTVWCLITLSLAPAMFQYITTPGSDIGSVAFTTFGGVLILVGSIILPGTVDNYLMLFVGGAFFGLGALLRHHASILAVGFFGAIIISPRGSFEEVAAAVLGFAVIFSFQMFANIFSGHKAFETNQLFNVYKFVHGINWHYAELNQVPDSSCDYILKFYRKFSSKHRKAFFRLFKYILPSIVGSFLFEDPILKQVSISIMAALFFYLFIVIIGDSDRDHLLAYPFAVYQSILVLHYYVTYYLNYKTNTVSNFQSYVLFSMVIGIIIFNTFSIRYIVKRLRYRIKANQTYLELERFLKNDGLVSPLQVLSLEFEFYLPNIKPYCLYNKFNSWLRYDTYGFNQEFPIIDRRNLEAFFISCNEQKIEYLVLRHDSFLFFDKLKSIYDETEKIDKLEKIGQSGEFKIFKIF